MTSTPRVVFVGAVHEALPALRAIVDHPVAKDVLVITLTDDLLAHLSGAVDVAAYASKLGVDVWRVADVNDAEVVERICDLEPDLMVVVGWTRLIREELLEVPRHGCVGFHASLLPHGRGRAPVNWSILRGEPKTGNTMMLLSPGADTGDIVDQRVTPIYLDDTCSTLYERVAELGAGMLTDHLDDLLSGNIAARSQTDENVVHFPKRTPSMGVMDWQRSPVEAHNWIRAMTQPYPGAFTDFRGQRVMLWASTPPLHNEAAGSPGEIVSIDVGGLRVATSDGSLVVTEMSSLSGPRAAAHECARQLGIRAGDRFGQPSPEWVSWARGEGPKPDVLAYLEVEAS